MGAGVFIKKIIKKFFGWVREVILVIGFASMLIFWQLAGNTNDNSFLNRMEFLFYDFRMQVAAKLSESEERVKNVVVIDIDEASLLQEGRWPWSRNRMADLVDKLTEAGVAVVAFDVVFSEPESDVLLKAIRNSGIKDEQLSLLENSLEEWNPDAHFGLALKNTDSVLGFLFHSKTELEVGQLRQPVAELPEDTAIYSSTGYTLPVKEIQRHSSRDGFVSNFRDPDGVIRRTPLLMSYNRKAYPSLALAAAMQYLLIENITLDYEEVRFGDIKDLSSVQLTDVPIYTDPTGQVLVPYTTAQRDFEYISAKDVLNGEVGPELVADTIAFVGTSAVGLVDLISTPFTTGMPGVEIHAIVAQNIVEGSFPFRPLWITGAVIVFEIILILVLVILFKGRRPVVMLSLAIVAFASVTGASLWIWMKWEMDVPMVISILITILIFLWYLIAGFVNQFKKEQKIKNMFAQYTPPAHIDQMLNNPDEYTMEGESKELTVLFADIRSFTTISEQLTASELKKYLNTFFTPITEVIFNNKGTIDKYVGDMVMAFWGAPVNDPSHHMNAVVTALQMIEVAERVSRELVEQGYPQLQIGIGLNSGQMNVGDMGSEYRKSYTVLGDAVNLGSRLEGLTKYYGVKILVGEGTVVGCEPIAFRLCDRIKVKGKTLPIDAYEPLGPYAELSDDQARNLLDYHRALAYYRVQDWDAALEIFQDLQRKEPDCRLYALYIERTELLRTKELPVDWDGVFEHTTK